MPPTHRRTWQKCEGRAAALFGAKRQPGSGSSGRDDQTRSDSIHPDLFIETKLRPEHAARTLLDATRILAGKEGKTAVLALASKGRPGFVLCVHSADIEALVVAWCAANATDELMGKIRTAYDRLHDLN